MPEDQEYKAAEAVLIAARVLNNYQYGSELRDTQALQALRRLAQTAEERRMPHDKLAYRIIERFSSPLESHPKTLAVTGR